jgi:AcrR family transcriptional regulator
MLTSLELNCKCYLQFIGMISGALFSELVYTCRNIKTNQIIEATYCALHEITMSTRYRLMQAALESFTTQGVTSTTTRQIAELAGVNEVTLFRQFGNKHGLLLALLEEPDAFKNLGESLVRQVTPPSEGTQVFKDYASVLLLTLEKVPELIRSIIGEASQYPTENRRALGHGLQEVNRKVAYYLDNVIAQGLLTTKLAPEKLAALLNAMTLGYAIIEFTTENHQLWQDKDDFLESLVELLSQTDLSGDGVIPRSHNIETRQEIIDLPTNLVQQILQQARKSGLQDYALAYVLFATGVSTTEITALQKTHQIYDNQGHILQIPTSTKIRQVPVNQWVMGKRYGSYTNNPLTRWLKNRKDNHTAMFINEAGTSMSEFEIQEHWRKWTEGILTPDGKQPNPLQAQQTWRVEMLMRGMSLENLSILTGCTNLQLEPYAHRAKEKAALEQAARLDQKPN